MINVTKTEKGGYYLEITKKRFLDSIYPKRHELGISFRDNDPQNKLLRKFKNDNQMPGEPDAALNIVFTYTTAKVKMAGPMIEARSSTYLALKDELTTVIREEYLNKIKHYTDTYKNTLDTITQFYKKIDVYNSCAKAALRLGLHIPTVIDAATTSAKGADGDASFIQAKGLRHPLIEFLHQDIKYVPNDMTVGVDNTYGLMIYGINGSGKTSLIRAIGVNLVLAQMGMWVAADTFTFRPYTNILTKINLEDNIFKGESTFNVEMKHLKKIISDSTCNSLVLADELCAGTETTSAIGIVAATITHLVKQRSSFLFTSHLHELMTLSVFDDHVHDQIKTFHLHVFQDPQIGLVYERVLREGSGPSIYGLEVAQYIVSNKEFMRTANTCRQSYMGHSNALLDCKESRYNKDIHVDRCQICKHDVINDLDVHHIDFQCTANKEGMIGNYHKNRTHNLVILCKTCHTQVHHQDDALTIKGWKESSKGRVLDFSRE